MYETTIFFSIVGCGLLFWFFLGREKPARYRKKPVLTGIDLDLFCRLQRSLPECLICPNVAASALIEPTGIGKARQAAVDLIAGKKVGYAVFDEELQLVAIIELCHRSRATRREVARDGWFATAGIRTIRFHAKHLPSETKVRSSVFPRSDSTARPKLYASGEAGMDSIEFRRPLMHWRNTINAQL